jgi:hypothetical protein
MTQSFDHARPGRTAIRTRLLRLLLVLVPIGLAGCSLFGSDNGSGIEQKVAKEIWRSRDSYVRIENQDAPKGVTVPPNSQPVNLAPDQIRNALDAIKVQHDPKEAAIPLFSDWELDTLSKYVSEGLAQAAANQDVTFAIVGWHKGLLGLREPKLTTGRVFYNAGQLNLIVGQAQRDANAEDPYYRQQDNDRRLDPYVPGMRSFTIPHKWVLRAPPNAGVYSAANTTRTDWLVFTAQAMAAPPPGSRTALSAADAARYEQLRKEVERLQRDLQTVRQTPGAPAVPQAAPYGAAPAYPGYSAYPAAPTYQQPAPGYPAYPAAPTYQQPAPGYPAYPAAPAYQTAPGYSTAPAAPQAAGTPPAPGQVQSGGSAIDQRLMVLDDLMRKGLISEDEYQQRRAEILSGH